MPRVELPSVYEAGYERARRLNPDSATKYIEHTIVGDPVADAVIEALAPFDVDQVHRFIHAGMEQDEQVLADAPRLLRDFFDSIEAIPSWFDSASALPGCTAFHSYSDLFIPAFLVATLQNFTTLISKAFYLTERVKSDHGPRRVRQNLRHVMEIMLPGALLRHGEGWKLSVRIRLVHAQIRRLIRASGDWDEAVYGVPLSGAHMGLASANFSAAQLRLAARLGARMDADARAGLMQIWRYASALSGTPEVLLFEGNEADTTEFSRVAHACEPPPGHESAAIANTLIAALPRIAGKTDPAAQAAMVDHTYRVSRVLLGDEIADQLQFPRQRTVGLLPWMQLKRQFLGISHRILPSVAGKWRGANMAFLLEASMLDDLTYRIPDHQKADQATPW